MIGKKEMEVLKKNIGKKVKVCHTFYGSSEITKGILEEVGDFGYIKVDGKSMPFVGYSGFIKKIIRQDGFPLFVSPLCCPDELNLREEIVRDAVLLITFGKKIASRHRKIWKAMKKSVNL